MFEILLDGKKHKPGKPKAKVWRELTEFDEVERRNVNYMDYLAAHAEVVAKIFSNPEVTAEKILENYGVDEIMPLYREASKWFYSLIHSKLEELPNDPAAAAE